MNDWYGIQHGQFKRAEEIFDFHKTVDQLVDSFIAANENERLTIKLVNNFRNDQSNYVPKMVISDQARFI